MKEEKRLEWPQANTKDKTFYNYYYYIRVMTGFILYCINFTRNNDFTNHDMSLLRNNSPSKLMMIMMICCFFLSNLLQTTLHKTQLLFKQHTEFTDNNIVRSYKPINDKYKKMMWLSHHLYKTMFVTRIQWIKTQDDIWWNQMKIKILIFV